MPEREHIDLKDDLTPEQRHRRAGYAFGEEYYRRISKSRTDSNSSLTSYPLYANEHLRTMEPALFDMFMDSAETEFHILATEDLMKQGVPFLEADWRAYHVGRAFGRFARALYENNLGVGRSPIRRAEGTISPPDIQGTNKPQSGR
jgi:hypothetical protein